MRTTIKTLTYGTTHIIVAVMVAYQLTGNLAVSISLGLNTNPHKY